MTPAHISAAARGLAACRSALAATRRPDPLERRTAALAAMNRTHTRINEGATK